MLALATVSDGLRHRDKNKGVYRPLVTDSLLLLFRSHDVDDFDVGIQHPLFGESSQIGDGLVHVIGDDPLALGDMQVVDGHQRRLYRR